MAGGSIYSMAMPRQDALSSKVNVWKLRGENLMEIWGTIDNS